MFAELLSCERLPSGVRGALAVEATGSDRCAHVCRPEWQGRNCELLADPGKNQACRFEPCSPLRSLLLPLPG